ncbi:MAG: sulfatase-like hydrolase/transferase [Halioglobus sp.]|nr:sulfatase-like hydrolase/transferase [Halioglobus sp.]
MSGKKRILGILLLGAGAALVAVGILRSGVSIDTISPPTGLAEVIERKPRSIVLITTDTTRADHTSPYGAANVNTPNLQRLADQGVLFEQAFAVTPLTLPSHTSIMTGLYPPQTGVRNNGIHFADEKLNTMAEILTGQGYRSGAFVSASVLERRYGLDQGFEIYDDDMSKSRVRSPRMVPDRPAEFTVAAAREWLDTLEGDQPFFLWVHLYDPHAAYNPPPPFRDQFPSNPYAGEISYMDAQIGDLLAHPRIEQTPGVAVSVIADHGESLGEHGENTHGIFAYKATLHVPWILWVDDVITPARVSAPVSQVDLLPTLLDLASNLDGELAAGLPGRSLMNTIPATRPIYSESYLPFYTYGWAKLRVIRERGWEYISAPLEELYELKRDPRELTNQAQQRAEITHDMRNSMESFLQTAAPDGDLEQSLEVDQESLERLRALGYIAMGNAGPAIDGERLDPKDVIHLHTALEKARGFSNERLYAEAVRILEGLLVEDPNNLAALTDLASAHMKLTQFEQAQEVIEAALSLAPEHEQLLLILAQVERERSELGRSLLLVEQVLEINPTNMTAWQLKAQVEIASGKPDEALATLTGALQISPQHAVVNTLYAQTIELPAGQYPEAELRLRKATARDPYLPYAWRILGGLMEKLGREEEAEEAYRSGLNYSPDDARLHALLAVQLARREHPDAEAHLREAIRRETGFHGELYVSLGAELARKGRLDEARKFYARVLEVEPENAAAINNRAIAMARAGKTRQAIAELKALTSAYPEYADAHNNLAVLLLQKGDYTAARTHAGKATELAPEAARPWDILGAAQAGAGLTDQAADSLDRSLQLKPGYWSAHLHRGLLRIDQKDYQGAQADLEAAQANGGPLPEAYLALGDLYAGPLADPVRAQRYYQIYLEKFPSEPNIEDVRDRIWRIRMPGGNTEAID